MVAGREKAETTGKKHLQCFVIYKTRTKFSTVKKQLPTAHIERMEGNSTQAADYCKEDGDFMEFGVFEFIQPQGGACGGIKKAVNYRAIIDLAEGHDFDKIKDDHPGEYFRHYATIKRIAMDNPKPVQILNELKHEWIWGKTGLGKSSNARIENPGLYIKTHNKQWNGYKGEKVVLIDDLSKHEATWIGDYLKQWADHYPFPADVKYSQDLIRPEKIVVTSNYSIEELFGHDEDLRESLQRRFKERHIIVPFPQFVPIAPPSPIPEEDEGFASHSAHSEEDVQQQFTEAIIEDILKQVSK